MAAFLFALAGAVRPLRRPRSDGQHLRPRGSAKRADRRLSVLVVLGAALWGLRGALAGYGELLGGLGIQADGGAFFDVVAA